MPVVEECCQDDMSAESFRTSLPEQKETVGEKVDFQKMMKKIDSLEV